LRNRKSQQKYNIMNKYDGVNVKHLKPDIKIKSA
jgi:hypothetical protein